MTVLLCGYTVFTNGIDSEEKLNQFKLILSKH